MRNEAFPSIHCDLRFKFHCDLRSSGEGVTKRRMCHITSDVRDILPVAKYSRAPAKRASRNSNFHETEPCVYPQNLPSPYPLLLLPANGRCCPSGGVSFSFVSERKRNQKEREFKGCALKNPPNCTELLRSIKNSMFVLCHDHGSRLARKNCTKREKQR